MSTFNIEVAHRSSGNPGPTVSMFVSLIMWLEAITFIKLYELHSLVKRCKCIMQEDTKNMTNTL